MKSTCAKRWSALAAMVPTLGLLCSVALVTMSGCDTVARLTFPNLQFSSAKTSGLTPAAGSCQGSNGPAVLRMVMVDTANHPITPETAIDGVEVNMTKDSVKLSDGRLFSLPDVECESCSSISNSLTCDVSTAGFESSLARCNTPETLGVTDAPRFVSNLDKNQLFGVVIENTGSLSGRLPSSLSALFPDVDGDGRGDQVFELLSQRPERATDRTKLRGTAFSQALTNWQFVQDAAAERTATTYFGAWSFAGGQASLKALVNGGWTTSFAGASSALNSLPSTPEQQQAAVFESVANVLSSDVGFADPRFSDAEKVLVVFVDGHDEVRFKAQTAQTVIDAANATNTRVFIVHLDPQIQTELNGNPLIVDDPAYIVAQDGCTSDSECKNFEECRPMMRFSANVGQGVTIPDEARKDLSFCLPKRDENGRLGPIDDYAEIACATGGGYVYVNNTGALVNNVSWLPYTLDGLWEVDVNVDAFSRQLLPESSPYLVQATMQVTLSGDAKSAVYSQKGEGGFDNRFAIFSK